MSENFSCYSQALIKEIHQKLLENVRGQEQNPGNLRKSQNWIGSTGCSISEAMYVPPPPEDMLDALSDWENFLHETDDIPLLLKIGLAHAQFETIHPFLDGNGRVGRLLITFLLCEKKELQKPVLYLSHYFKENRREYYELLQGTRDSGDWESWIYFFLKGVDVVSREAKQTAGLITELRERHRLLIQDNFGNVTSNGLKVLELLFTRPIISVESISKLTGVSFVPANELMKRFVKHSILDEITGQARNRRYQYSDYVNLFSTL